MVTVRSGGIIMSEFEQYIQRYIKNKNITPEEAKQEAIIKFVKHHYEDPDRNDNVWW